jgi:hypothetical protein
MGGKGSHEESPESLLQGVIWSVGGCENQKCALKCLEMVAQIGKDHV